MWGNVKVGDTLYVLNPTVSHTLKQVKVIFIDNDYEYMSCSNNVYVERFYNTHDSLCWEGVNSVAFLSVEDYEKYLHRQELISAVIFGLKHNRIDYDVVCDIAKKLGVYKERQ